MALLVSARVAIELGKIAINHLELEVPVATDYLFFLNIIKLVQALYVAGV